MLNFDLKSVLSARKMTLAALSKLTSISTTSLSQLSTGKSRGIQFDNLEKICLALDCKPEDLFRFDEDPYFVIIDEEIFRSGVSEKQIAVTYAPAFTHYVDESNPDEVRTLKDFKSEETVSIMNANRIVIVLTYEEITDNKLFVYAEPLKQKGINTDLLKKYSDIDIKLNKARLRNLSYEVLAGLLHETAKDLFEFCSLAEGTELILMLRDNRNVNKDIDLLDTVIYTK